MTKSFGQDLHRILKNRKKRLFGIINGIDYNTYNPGNDVNIFKNYTYNSLEDKYLNKEYIQNKYNLPINSQIPVICTTSRVTFQKGFDLILKTIIQLLNLDVQVIFMGDGDKNYLKSIRKLVKENPKKLVWLPFSPNEETLLYAGSDLFLLPSNHEPCGINQLIAMRYGCVPIVREVGGLYDTVDDFDPSTKKGTGFTFKAENPFTFYGAIIRALEAKKNKSLWNKIIKRIMKESNSWEIPAKKYIELYKRVQKK
jgi:starch synthase